MSFFSYGQGEGSLSDGQVPAQLDPKASSLKPSEGANSLSNSKGKSVLSVKGEGLIFTSIILDFSYLVPVAPVISLEL